MLTASSNIESRDVSQPPQMSKLLVVLGAISMLTPFSLDLYLPSLPLIATDLSAAAASVQLTLPAFFIGLSISQLFFGSVADRVGRRPPLLAGLAMLAVGSMGCALAHSVATLLIWRTVQALGVGAASVIPRAIVRDRFDVAHTARALSLLGIITGLGPILAPQIGGLILLVGSWRFEFWLLAAMALICWVTAYYAVAESIPAQRTRAIGPKLWLELLGDRRYLRYALPANLVQSSMFAYIAGAPFVFINLMKLTPQQFAWTFGCNAVGLMIAGRINAHIVSSLGPELIFRRSMIATAVLGLIMFAMALGGWGGFWGVAIPMFFFISTLGFNFSNGFALGLAPFGASAGTASALFGTLQFFMAGLAGATVSALYAGTASAMCGVMAGIAVSGVILYRLMR